MLNPSARNDRATILARIADEFMEAGILPLELPEGCTGMWAEHILIPGEIWFYARYPDTTVTCSRLMTEGRLLPFIGTPLQKPIGSEEGAS